MKALISSFRRGRKTQNTRQMILEIDSVTDKEKATSFIGKIVVWKSPAGMEIKGKVASAHGNSGAVRAIFEKGMPGQSVGNSVEIE